MSEKNMCPACRKQFTKMPPVCICGQHLIKEDADNSKCPFIEEGGEPCNETASRSYKTKAGDWYCPTHADYLLQQSYKR